MGMVAKKMWLVKVTKYTNWPCAAFENIEDAVALVRAMHREEAEDELPAYIETVPVFESSSSGFVDKLMLLCHDAEIEQLQAVTDMICEEMDAKDAHDSEVPDGE